MFPFVFKPMLCFSIHVVQYAFPSSSCFSSSLSPAVMIFVYLFLLLWFNSVVLRSREHSCCFCVRPFHCMHASLYLCSAQLDMSMPKEEREKMMEEWVAKAHEVRTKTTRSGKKTRMKIELQNSTIHLKPVLRRPDLRRQRQVRRV